jgi:dienelactone hydrolase
MGDLPSSLLMMAVTFGSTTIVTDATRGERVRDAYFRNEVQRIARASLADIGSREDWKRKEPEMRRQLLDMLGLWPMPPRTDLHATITGKIDAAHFTVEKLHFQSVPGLYVTANLYLPKGATAPAPAVLYVCGHSPVVEKDIVYGNKVAYQHHAGWYASHGYVCLVLDTLQMGEVPGIHHGTHHLNQWWWHTLGYTPAGIECWNAIRGIDYLQTRKEVDAKRIGVAGRSGGGATSWWVMAADERVACAVPVAGLADLQAHLIDGESRRYPDGVISGHCDCMYFINTYRWDFAQVIALCAPRPVLLGNTDADDIFPVGGYKRPAEKARQIYQLLGASDHFALVEAPGPHQDLPELRRGEYRWMNRWLKGDNAEVTEQELPKFTPQQLKVLDRMPDDAINATIQETFHRPAHPELPLSPAVAREWWAGQAPAWRDALRERVFGGWPVHPPDLRPRPAADVSSDGLRVRAFDFTSEDGVDLRLWLLTATEIEKPALVVLSALDESGWRDLTLQLGLPFQSALQLPVEVPRNTARFLQTRKALAFNRWAFAMVAPRGIGPTRWSEVSPVDGKPNGQHVRRRFALIGETLDGQRVWDVRRAIGCVRSLPDLAKVPLWLQGRGEMAGIALYAALFEPGIARIDLWHPPASHHDGPIFLNVARILDMPQAMALAFPRTLRVYVKDDAEAAAWDWPMSLQKALGKEYLQIRRVGD